MVPSHPVEVALSAVIVAVTDNQPRVLTVVDEGGRPALPSGPLGDQDPTLERALRRWVSERTGIEVGYVEQLYTFGDRVRVPDGLHMLSIAYLALVREADVNASRHDASWVDLYRLFPWEDHRGGEPDVLCDLLPQLRAWAGIDPALQAEREDRLQIVFGGSAEGSIGFDGVRALERYELLYEAGLLAESVECRGPDRSTSMVLDHRRMAATALSRLRGKLTYRPLVFELLPGRFTMLQLQRVVESLAGVELHKQNFRRLVESGGLVEGTDEFVRTGGRPAELFRFRPVVLRERPRPGFGSPWS